MLNKNKINEIAIKTINKSINEWAFEDKEGHVYFIDGILQFLKEINKELKDGVIKDE